MLRLIPFRSKIFLKELSEPLKSRESKTFKHIILCFSKIVLAWFTLQIDQQYHILSDDMVSYSKHNTVRKRTVNDYTSIYQRTLEKIWKCYDCNLNVTYYNDEIISDTNNYTL